MAYDKIQCIELSIALREVKLLTRTKSKKTDKMQAKSKCVSEKLLNYSQKLVR